MSRAKELFADIRESEINEQLHASIIEWEYFNNPQINNLTISNK